MGLESTFFDSALKTADHQLTIIHYIPVSQRIITSPGHARIIPHTDFGLCTLLFQDSVGGLEVDPFHTGKFVPATPVKGTCIINVADLLQRLANDRLKSTLHQVVSPPMTKVELEELGPDGLLPGKSSFRPEMAPSGGLLQ
jgi:isopenicillin N synthase-like dioxygenase